MSSDEEYELDAEQVMEELQAKEEQLRLAAEFGQTLLERTEELQEENAERDRQLEVAAQQMEEHEYRIKELAGAQARLAAESQEKDAMLREQQEAMEKREAELEERLRAASAGDKSDAVAAAAAQTALLDEKAADKQKLDKLTKAAEEAKLREAETNAAREMEESERIEAQKAKRAMEKQVEASEAMMAKQKEEMEDAYNKMEEEAEKAAGKAREAERKHQEVMDLQQKLAQMEQQLALAHATRTTPKAADLGDSLDVVPEGMSLLDEMGGGGQSLFDELENDETQPEAPAPAPAPAPAINSTSPRNSMSPRSIDDIKQQATFEAKTAAAFKGKMALRLERAKLKKEYEAKIEAATAASSTVDQDKLKADMEAQYKQQQQLVAGQMEADYQAQMEKEIAAMKAEAEAQFKASLAAAQKTKEYEMRVKQVSKALGLGSSVSSEAAKILGQINAEMLDSSNALAAKAKTLADERTLAKTKAMIASHANIAQVTGQSSTALNAEDLAKEGLAVSQSIFENFSKMSEDEKADMLQHLDVLKGGAATIRDGDESYKANLSKVEDGFKKMMEEQKANSKVAGLHGQGQGIAAGIRSPADMLKAFQENEVFVQDVKAVVCDYVTNLVTSATIPKVTAEKKWGGYTIDGLKFAAIELRPEHLTLDVKKSVHINISKVDGLLDTFKWTLDKTTFPKVTDKGTGTAKMVNFSLKVSFDIVTDGDGALKAEIHKPRITMDRLDVAVADCNHQWIFNKLLSWFQKSVKEAVATEIRSQAESRIAELGDKVTAVMGMLT